MCLPPYLNSGLPVQQEKKVEAAVVVFLEEYMQGVLASMAGLSGFSN